MSGIEQQIVQRVLKVGVRAASVIDLVSVAFCRRAEDVQESEAAARQMLQRFRSIRGLSEASRADLQQSTGLDEFDLVRCQALMELGRRASQSGHGPKDTIDSAEDVMALLDYLRFEKKEHFLAILLDAKNTVMRVAQIHVGTLTMSVVGAREVFREAINDGAASIIVVHNHPSGDPTPSPEDIEVTRRLVEIGNLLDIPVVDHVIIGERRYTSLCAQGMIGK